MVALIALLDATQDRYRARLVGFVHDDRLESALQRLVLLEVLLIFIQRGGTDRAQLATRERRLQDVGRVHGTRAIGTGTHEGVYLIDEEDALASRLDDVVDHPLEALLKLTLILGTCHQRTHVE